MAKKSKSVVIKPQTSINEPPRDKFSKETDEIKVYFERIDELDALNTGMVESFMAAYNKIKEMEGRTITWEGKARKGYDKVFNGLVEYMEQTKSSIDNFKAVADTISGKLEGVESKQAKIVRDVESI